MDSVNGNPNLVRYISRQYGNQQPIRESCTVNMTFTEMMKEMQHAVKKPQSSKNIQ